MRAASAAAVEGLASVGAIGHQTAIACNEVLFIDRRQPVLERVIEYPLAIKQSERVR